MTSSLMVPVRAARTGVNYFPAGVFFAVDGTVYPGAPAPPFPPNDSGTGIWCGFSSGIAGGLMNAQDGLWAYRGVGYPATTFPMWPSVQAGRHILIALMTDYATGYHRAHGSLDGLAITMSGYSQGSMVTDQVWVLDVLPDNGVLHYLLPYIWRSYQFGHIFRTPGIAHANAMAGLSEDIKTDGVETGGIGTSLDLTEAQTNYPAPDGKPVVCSAANSGDIYTACPVGLNPWTAPAPQGKVGKIFEQIIMQPSFTSLLSTIGILGEPLGAVEELFNAMKFFASGTNSPHYQYFPQMNACVDDMLAIGNSLPHSGC